MVDIIVLVIVIICIILALYSIYKRKKKGDKCLGCPYSGSCSGHCEQREK